MFKNPNSVQLLGNNFGIILISIIAIFIIFFSEHYKGFYGDLLKLKRINLVFLIICGLLIYRWYTTYQHGLNAHKASANKYSDEYILSIMDSNKDQKINSIGVYLYGEKDYYRWSIKYSESYNLSTFLQICPQYYHTINLSVHEIPVPSIDQPLERTRHDIIIGTRLFYRFVENQKALDRFISIEQCQLEFIKKHNVGYLIASKRAKIAPSIQKLIYKKIIDNLSGERFCFLDTK